MSISYFPLQFLIDHNSNYQIKFNLEMFQKFFCAYSFINSLFFRGLFKRLHQKNLIEIREVVSHVQGFSSRGFAICIVKLEIFELTINQNDCLHKNANCVLYNDLKGSSRPENRNES